jgi:hypothetical protein
LVDGKLYLELHNFSFVKNQTQVSSKSTSLPWLNTTASQTSSSQISNAHLIHQEQKIPESTKHKFQKPFQPNKIVKLADIATNAIIINDNNDQNDQNEQVNEEIIDDQMDIELSGNESNISQANKTNETVKKIQFYLFINNKIIILYSKTILNI